MKACILKAIVWNDRNYKEPAGLGAKSGYPADVGFGHEEWNNNNEWMWKGYKVFHTEATNKLFQYSKNGDLGILMVSSHEGKQFALGIATKVFENTKEDMKNISTELNLFNYWKQLWDLELVKDCFEDDIVSFKKFWKKECKWVRWKCDPIYYYWFPNPIEIKTQRIFGKARITQMFGRYQPVRPEDIIKIIEKHIPRKKRVIIDWLLNGEFDETFLKSEIQDKKTAARQKKSNKSNAPTNKDIEYWVYGKRVAEPLHSRLQLKFVDFLKRRKLKPIENKDYIDVQYKKNGKTYFAEIKPTEKIETKYAIRMAIGQLLEYKYRFNQNAALEIVLSSKPKPEEILFVKKLKMRLWYFDQKSFRLVS